MVPAIHVWIAGSALLMALATASLARAAGRVFGLPVILRLLLVGLVAASPLLSLGLELGNVSVAVVALCFLALTDGPQSNSWLYAIGLAAALLLKPHIAFWALVALLLARTPLNRKLLIRTAWITGFACALIVLWMLYRHTLMPQMSSYRAMVASELSNGSMAPGNRDLMELPVQITSFSQFLGYLISGTPAQLINFAVLLVLAAALGWSALRYSRSKGYAPYVVAPAAFAFGLTATYHRQADSILLFFLLPYVLFLLHRSLKDPWAWSALGLLIAGSLGPTLDILRVLAGHEGVYAALRFLALRQAAIVNLCLLVLLIGALATGSRATRRASPGASAALL